MHETSFTTLAKPVKPFFSPASHYRESPQWRLCGMANRIKELRRAQGLTLQQLADKAGCSLQQIQRLELGSRRLTDQWMRRVAWALGVPISALLPDFPVDNRQFIESPEEKAVIRWWRAMDPPERDMIVAIARAKGVEILADNTKKRRA